MLRWRRSNATSVIASGQSLVEKIVQRYAVGLAPGHQVRSGDFLYIRPQHVMTHDNTGAVMSKFAAIGATEFASSRQAVFTIDHDVQNTSEKNLSKYRSIADFASRHRVDFYPPGRGIGHQVLVEEGYAFPQTLTVASDSHSNMYGGIGCLGTPVVRTDAAAIWATGQTWWQVPRVAHVLLYNKPSPGVTGKDIIIALCGLFGNDEVLNYCVEFGGDGVAHLSVDDRLSIANMTTEWGTLAGVFPVDGVTIDWLKARAARLRARGSAKVPSDGDAAELGVNPRLNEERIAELEASFLEADKDACYGKVLSLDLATVRPQVAGPNHVNVTQCVSQLEESKLAIQKAYLVSCVNSRLSDIAEAAAVLRGRKVADGVSFYIAPASAEVLEEAEASGDWQVLLDAGAKPLPAGCGPCVGLGTGLLADGEVGISATNRNFKGRMGSPKASAYLASPAVVAASAAAGFICGPITESHSPTPVGSVIVPPQPPRGSTSVSLVDGFPRTITGRVVFCPQDNLNTDGIYPGKYTYQDNMTPAEMAKVVMENYDPQFTSIVQRGDILVGGFNFGTGSSREQAATALMHAGVQLILVGSASETYKRNALNNGFLVLEAPLVIRRMLESFADKGLTVQTGWNATIDFATATLRLQTDEGEELEYELGAVGPAAQELVLAGGLENWIVQRIQNQKKHDAAAMSA